MIEKTVIEYLSNKLSVPVYMERPATVPKEFVLVQKTGSSVENLIYSATFALQSYAPSKLKAAELNELVKNAMDGIIELNEISKSKLNSDYDYTDTDNKEYRYQAVYDLVHY